ncbi:hypothetical protein ASG14_06975 [Pedobacter sp. Leaf194]|nr:hypothetical protein ASG14_06975 [Pedobacter sp. Leaf194]
MTALTCISCKKALQKDPVTEYSSNNFWKEPAQASAALSGAYLRLQTALNTEFSYYGDGRADLLTLVQENNTQSIAVVKNRLDPSQAFTDWGGFYRVINQSNLIIKNVKEMNSKGLYVNKTTEYNRVLGQALGLRAMCYFYMTRVWGNVPLIVEPTENNGDINSFKIPRTDTLQVYKQVSADLTQARNLLPASYSDIQQTRATLTRGGIDAILTDYYMWRNNIDSALITSKRITDNSTQYRLATLANPAINYFALPQADIDNTEYASMFTNGFGPESIFEIAYSYEENTTSGLLALFAGGIGVAQFYASTDFTSSFTGSDLRALVNFKSEVQIFKNFPKGSFDRTTDNDKNIILYRLADILLMRAEAFVQKGDNASAFALLKQVRERAFGPISTTAVPNPNNDPINGPTGSVEQAKFISSNKKAAQNIILNERKKELCFEGKRFYDLIRTGKAIEVMGPINGLLTAPNILWPINLNVIRQNPLIEQNSFYK